MKTAILGFIALGAMVGLRPVDRHLFVKLPGEPEDAGRATKDDE